ncbi:10037_t:CDS:2 [Entrophospora sp. SA101]|nr:10037_t:CDS:2 [Entrophospora sp. SA101]
MEIKSGIQDIGQFIIAFQHKLTEKYLLNKSRQKFIVADLYEKLITQKIDN